MEFFGSKHILGPKKILGPTKILGKKIFWVKEMKNNQQEQWPTIQVNGGPPPQSAVSAAAHQVQSYGVRIVTFKNQAC